MILPTGFFVGSRVTLTSYSFDFNHSERSSVWVLFPHPSGPSRAMNIPVLSRIPHDRNVRRSINKGELLIDWKPDSPAAKEIKKLADKLVEGGE